MIVTSGLSCSETSLADIGDAMGSAAKCVVSSKSLSPSLTIDGNGASETTRTAAVEVTIPLTISKDDENASHA